MIELGITMAQPNRQRQRQNAPHGALLHNWNRNGREWLKSLAWAGFERARNSVLKSSQSSEWESKSPWPEEAAPWLRARPATRPSNSGPSSASGWTATEWTPASQVLRSREAASGECFTNVPPSGDCFGVNTWLSWIRSMVNNLHYIFFFFHFLFFFLRFSITFFVTERRDDLEDPESMKFKNIIGEVEKLHQQGFYFFFFFLFCVRCCLVAEKIRGREIEKVLAFLCSLLSLVKKQRRNLCLCLCVRVYVFVL